MQVLKLTNRSQKAAGRPMQMNRNEVTLNLNKHLFIGTGIHYKTIYKLMHLSAGKRTDVWSRDFII